MQATEHLRRGRESFVRRSWTHAYVELAAADEQSRLQPEDLECLAISAYLLGKDAEWSRLGARAHNDFLRKGDSARAARAAFWLGLALLDKGEMAPGAGWLARAKRVLDDADVDGVERGFLLLPVAHQQVGEGDFRGAYATFSTASDIAHSFEDPDLLALTTLGMGQALLGLGRTAEGVNLLDEVMIAVTAGDVSPLIVGIAYCGVIEACHEIYDLRRAREWTAALGEWCASQPDLVPYRGQCLIHRAEIMQLRGEWPHAMEEAQKARQWLSDPPGQPALGAAMYQLGEIHGLRGDFALAEEAYREANQWGHSPQPGLARLRLAQGQVGPAQASIRRHLGDAQGVGARAKVLPVYIDIMLAANDLAAARAGADELSEITSEIDSPLLRAVTAYSQGAVLLAEGDARGAVDALRRASKMWRDLDAPYEAARARMLAAVACRELGDEDTAEMELDAAGRAFHELGAVPDLARVEHLMRKSTPPASGRLSGRELQVLSLVAAGNSNRSIADELVISEKTVARHMSNIFAKLGVSSRSGATAYAYENDLV